MIVESTGNVIGTPQIDSFFPHITLSDTALSTAVMGVFLDADDGHNYTELDGADPAAWYNAVGEGHAEDREGCAGASRALR